MCSRQQLFRARLALVALTDPHGVRVLEVLERAGAAADGSAAAREVPLPDDVRVPFDPWHRWEPSDGPATANRGSGHYLDACFGARVLHALLAHDLLERTDRDLDLLERRLARRQPLKPETGREQRHQHAIAGVPPREADQLVRDSRDH